MTFEEKRTLMNLKERVSKLEAAILVLTKRGPRSEDDKETLKQWRKLTTNS